MLLERQPCGFMPVQTIFNGITVLHERFFHFLAHLRRRRSAERGHLAVPARRKLPAKVFEVREGVQGAEMIDRARTRAGHYCGVDKLVSSLVRVQRAGYMYTTLYHRTDVSR